MSARTHPAPSVGRLLLLPAAKLPSTSFFFFPKSPIAQADLTASQRETAETSVKDSATATAFFLQPGRRLMPSPRFVAAAAAAAAACVVIELRSAAFQPASKHLAVRFVQPNAEPEQSEAAISGDAQDSLSQKMTAWEASDTQQRADSGGGGGLTPGSSGADSFDIGLYLAFPPLFLSLMLFLLFPFLRESIDIGELPPPQA